MMVKMQKILKLFENTVACTNIAFRMLPRTLGEESDAKTLPYDQLCAAIIS